MSTTTQRPTPDFGEPWIKFNGFVSKQDGKGIPIYSKHNQRIVDCVNACAGMTDPAKEIEQLRQERDEARERLEAMREAMREAAAIFAQIPVAYDHRFFRAGQWANSALAKLHPFLKP